VFDVYIDSYDSERASTEMVHLSKNNDYHLSLVHPPSLPEHPTISLATESAVGGQL
jgi:hypothetical protein